MRKDIRSYALNNLSSELFLYLHFADMPTCPIVNSDEMKSILRQLLGSYSKTNLIEDHYASNVEVAIVRGLRTIYDSDGYPANHGTDVHKLVSSILTMKPRKNESVIRHS